MLASVLRARQMGTALTTIAAVSAATLLAGDNVIELRYGSGAGIPYATLLPALSGSIVAAAARTGVAEFEGVAARPLAVYRALALGIAVAWAVLWAVIAQPSLPGSPGDLAAVRNVAGFTGLGLLAAQVVGGRLAWIAPVGVAISALSLAGGTPQRAGEALLWPLAADHSVPAAAVALASFAAGVTLVLARGTREPVATEAEV